VQAADVESYAASFDLWESVTQISDRWVVIGMIGMQHLEWPCIASSNSASLIGDGRTGASTRCSLYARKYLFSSFLRFPPSYTGNDSFCVAISGDFLCDMNGRVTRPFHILTNITAPSFHIYALEIDIRSPITAPPYKAKIDTIRHFALSHHPLTNTYTLPFPDIATLSAANIV
jgi:hypothetical protein